MQKKQQEKYPFNFVTQSSIIIILLCKEKNIKKINHTWRENNNINLLLKIMGKIAIIPKKNNPKIKVYFFLNNFI